jgi:hypothetical protein
MSNNNKNTVTITITDIDDGTIDIHFGSENESTSNAMKFAGGLHKFMTELASTYDPEEEEEDKN